MIRGLPTGRSPTCRHCPDLEKFFFLDPFDRDAIARSRTDSHRLGVAVQIGTVRCKELLLEKLGGRDTVRRRDWVAGRL
ncbi:DUF4158 domain-containing protein [Streptosporangium saharense]|uniref:DUF4158 domain-containing protein n=1 Tax=Streptosporangium saharense TaxID=1706840 RepID=UPI00162129A8